MMFMGMAPFGALSAGSIAHNIGAPWTVAIGGIISVVGGVFFGVRSAVEQGEDALRSLGFRQFRVRHHGEIARLEISRDELAKALTPEMFAEFTRIFKALGFTFVTVDTEGFRSGSMNTSLAVQSLVQLLS
jgi:hypothetical protein